MTNGTIFISGWLRERGAAGAFIASAHIPGLPPISDRVFPLGSMMGVIDPQKLGPSRPDFSKIFVTPHDIVGDNSFCRVLKNAVSPGPLYRALYGLAVATAMDDMAAVLKHFGDTAEQAAIAAARAAEGAQ